MHYCIVISSLGAGGAERVIAQLSRHWFDNEIQITIVSFDNNDERIYHGFPPDIRIIRLGNLPPLARVGALRRTLKRIRPDLIISFLTKINVISLMATTGTRFPVIVSERNNPEKQKANPLWRWALGLLYRRAGVIVCQTVASVRCIPAHSRDRVVVIPNPVARARYCAGQSTPALPMKLLAVGRLTSQKGFDLLVDAYAKIADRFPDWQLDIWGDGPEREALATRISQSQLEGKVHLRGLSTEPGSWVAAGHAFILSSRFEGFPNVLGEAMAAGMPVIATDCDFGPSELIRDGETGILVEPENSDALAKAMVRLFQDKKFREKLAAEAPEICDSFSLEKVSAMWDDAALQLLCTSNRIQKA